MRATWRLAALAAIVLLALGALERSRSRWQQRPAPGHAEQAAELINDDAFISATSRDVPQSRSLLAVSGKYKAKILLSAALTSSVAARRIIDLLERSGSVEAEVLFRPPLDLSEEPDTAVLILPALKADYLGKSSLMAFPNPELAAREMVKALNQLLFYGGHLVLTAPTDPRDVQFVAMLLRALTGTSLVCSGEPLANQQLGTSYRTPDAPYTAPLSLPDVEGQVQPLSCNFPSDTVTHYQTVDGYPTVVEWPEPPGLRNPPRGSIWLLGFTFESISTAWDQGLLDLIGRAAASVDPSLVYPGTTKPPPPPPPPRATRPPPPAWLNNYWGYNYYTQSPPPPPSRQPPSPPRSPPPPAAGSEKACTAADLKHAEYGSPAEWYLSSTPLVPCRHEVNKQLVVPQCLDGTVVYWDAETGTQQLSLANFSASCSSPCLTFQSDVYYRHGEVEKQLVYDVESSNCSGVNRTRTCSDGAFGPWSLVGPRYREEPCDGTCRDEQYDIGAVFLPGQTQVRIFYSAQYVPYGTSCAAVAVARVRTCSATATGAFSDWSAGPAFSECSVQCPPPDSREGEVVASFAPSGAVLGLGAVLNRTMYGSSVADEVGRCSSKVLQRTCGRPTSTRIHLETPQQQLAETYGEVRLAWLPTSPWQLIDPEYPHTTCHASCRAPDGKFVPHGTSYSFLMYAAGGSIDKLPVAPPSPVPPPPSAAAGRHRRLDERAQQGVTRNYGAVVSELDSSTEKGQGQGRASELTSRRRQVLQRLLQRAPATAAAGGGVGNDLDVQALAARLLEAIESAAGEASAARPEDAGRGDAERVEAWAAVRRLLQSSSSDYDYYFDYDYLIDSLSELLGDLLGDYSLSDFFSFLDYFDAGYFDVSFWGDYGSSGDNPAAATPPPPLAGGSQTATSGVSSYFYGTSCYNRSVNVYSTCRDGVLASQWLDRSGQVQTNLSTLTPFCKQTCSTTSGDRYSTGEGFWTRNAYSSRQSYDDGICMSLTDSYTCRADASDPWADPASSVERWLGFTHPQLPDGTQATFAACGPTCAPECAQSMLGDGRPDPACNVASCCYDGADYEVWMLNKLSTAQRLALINTQDATQDAVRLLGDVCNLQWAYDNNTRFGDELQRLLVVAACRLQMALLGGSDVTGVQVPNVVLQPRSSFQTSIEQLLGALRLLEGAMLDASSAAAQSMELLQQYYYRSPDDPITWAALQPTYIGAQLQAGETSLQSKLDMVIQTTQQNDLVGAVMQRQLRDITMSLAATDLQGDQAKLLLDRVLRSSLVQEALLTSPSGLLLLPDGKLLPDGRGSSSFSILDEWSKGDVVMYYTPPGSSTPSVVTGPVVIDASTSSRGSRSPPPSASSSSSSSSTTYAHFLSVGLGVDSSTGGFVFQLAAVPVEGRVLPSLPSRYSLKETDAKNYTGTYMIHKPSGMVLVPSGDRVLIQGGTLEQFVMGKATTGPRSFDDLARTLKDVGASVTGGDAWDADGDGLVSVEELWAFLKQLGLVQELGESIWNAWRQALYDDVGGNVSWAGGLLDGYTHSENASYNAIDAVAALLRRAVGKTDGTTHSFWGYHLWDADHDGVISQADVLRTVGSMGYVLGDGVKLITQYYSEYGAAGNVSSANTNAAASGRRRRGTLSCIGGVGSGSSSSSSSSGGSGGGGAASSGGKPEKGWGYAMGGIGSAMGVSSASNWVSDSMTQPLSDTADSGTSLLMQVTSTAMEAGSVLSDCADGAKSAVRGGWLGLAGGASQCLGSLIGSAIGGPTGEAVKFVGETIATGINIVTAPARAIATVAVEVVGGIASAVSSFFSGWFDRRRLITAADCFATTPDPIAAIFDGIGRITGSGGLFNWLLSDSNFAQSTSDSGIEGGPTNDFFNVVFSGDYSRDYGGGGVSSWGSFLSGDYDYSYSSADYSNDYVGGSSWGLAGFLFSSDYSSSGSSASDYSSGGFLGLFDDVFGGDYSGGSSGDYSGFGGGLFDGLFGGDYGDYSDYSGGGSGDYGGGGDYGFFSWFGRRRSALSHGGKAPANGDVVGRKVVGHNDDDDDRIAKDASADRRAASADAALRACTEHVLDLPSAQARACLRLLVKGAAAAARRSAGSSGGATTEEPAEKGPAGLGAPGGGGDGGGTAGGPAAAAVVVNEETAGDISGQQSAARSGLLDAASGDGSGEDSSIYASASGNEKATTALQRETLRVAVWLARQCYSRDVRGGSGSSGSSGTSGNGSGGGSGGSSGQQDDTTAGDEAQKHQQDQQQRRSMLTGSSATAAVNVRGRGSGGGGGGASGALQRAASLADSEAGHWGAVADGVRPHKSYSKTLKNTAGLPSSDGGGGGGSPSLDAESRRGAASQAGSSSRSTATGDGDLLCAALRSGLRDILLQRPPPTSDVEPSADVEQVATAAAAAAAAEGVTLPADEGERAAGAGAGADGAVDGAAPRGAVPETLRLQLALWLRQAAAGVIGDEGTSAGNSAVKNDVSLHSDGTRDLGEDDGVFSSGSSRESVPVPLRPQRDARRRRRLAAADSGDAAVVRQTEVQAKLQMYDDAVNEMHRVAQVGFARQADRSSPLATARRAASMKRLLQSSKLPPPQHQQQQQQQRHAQKQQQNKVVAAASTVTAGGTDAGNAGLGMESESSLESLLGLDRVQRLVLAHAHRKPAAAGSSPAKRQAAAKGLGSSSGDGAAAKGDASGGSGGAGGVGGGLQSRMTQRWWGSVSDRVVNRQAAKKAEAAAKANVASDGAAAGDDATKAVAATATTTVRSYSTTSEGTTTSPYLGPDVPPPAISLSDIDLEMRGDGSAGRPHDHMFQVLQPMLGPSFEGQGRDLAGLIRNMWAALDAVSGSQQVQAWLDIALELQNTVAHSPAVCTAADLSDTLKASQDKPGQWAAAATLRGRGGASLLQMYRSMVQTHLIRRLRQLALQVEMSGGAPSRALSEMEAALRNISALTAKEPVAGLLQKVYDAVKGTELASLPENATEAATAAAAPASPTAAAANAPRFGSNIAVSQRKTATVYFTMTSRTHAHVLRNLSQGLVATVQVPLPRQTKYFDVRLRGVAIRVLADRTSTVTVQHRSSQAAASNHAFVDGLGIDMLRGCASALSLPSSDADVAVAAKGPVSLYYPDPVAALTGRSLSYNHPVPASYCNVMCPSMGSTTSYVPADGTTSSGLGASLFSPYGSWLLQYRPRAGQAGFVKTPAGGNASAAAPDCLSTACTFYRAEALQLQFDVSYREILSAEFLGAKSSSFFSSPAGEDSDALAAGLLAASPDTSDPFPPAAKLPDQLTPLADLCSYRTANISMRTLTALNGSYSTVTPQARKARNDSAGSYTSFPASYTSEPSSQVSVSVTIEISGLSLQSLQGDTDTARNLIKGIKSYMFQGPAGVGKTVIRSVISKAAAAASGRRRSMAATTTMTAAKATAAAAATLADADADVVLEPLNHIRGHHWRTSSFSSSSSSSSSAAEEGSAVEAGGDNLRAGADERDPGGGDAAPPPVTAPARLVYRRRRRLQSSSGETLSVVVATSELDVIGGNQASGLLNNGDRANSVLEEALSAYGLNVKVQVASVGLTTGDINAAAPPPAAQDTGGQKKLSAGAIAGIVIGSVVGVAVIAVLVVMIVRIRRNRKVAGAPW